MPVWLVTEVILETGQNRSKSFYFPGRTIDHKNLASSPNESLVVVQRTAIEWKPWPPRHPPTIENSEHVVTTVNPTYNQEPRYSSATPD